MLLRPLRLNARFSVFTLLLGACCYVATLRASEQLAAGPIVERALDVYVLCALFALLPGGLRKVVRGIVAAVLYAIALVDVACFEKFGATLSPTMLMLARETTGREAREFLESYADFSLLFSGVGVVVALFLLNAIAALRPAWLRFLWCGLLGGTKRAHRWLCRQRFARRWHVFVRRQRIWNVCLRIWNVFRRIFVRCGGALAVCGSFLAPLVAPFARLSRAGWANVVVGLCLVGAVVVSWENKRATARLFAASSIGEAERLMAGEPRAQLYFPSVRLAFALRAQSLAAGQLEDVRAASERAVVTDCSGASPCIVLIIGESYNKHHSQLYGYHLRTTPRQQRRADEGNLVAFKDVVSPWNLTSYVFKHMLSTGVVGDGADWSDAPLFPQLFRLAGYDVSFLTNQFIPHAADAVFDFSGGFFLNDSVLSPRLFSHRNAATHAYDEGLLADFDSLRANGTLPTEGPRLTIFHLLGQHVGYRSRCTNPRRVFGPEAYLKARPDLKQKRYRYLLADYDNATLYNDSIVDEIVRRFEGEDAIVVYVPDHGEDVFEPGRMIMGRDHSEVLTWETAHFEFEIPFWVYVSPRYAARRPELLGALRAAASRPFMTDALSHLLLGLAGISSPAYRADCDPLSPTYNARRPRLLRAATDYDRLRATGRRK